MNRRTGRIALLVVVGMVWAKELVEGWVLSRLAVALFVGGIACLWVSSEM